MRKQSIEQLKKENDRLKKENKTIKEKLSNIKPCFNDEEVHRCRNQAREYARSNVKLKEANKNLELKIDYYRKQIRERDLTIKRLKARFGIKWYKFHWKYGII